MNNKALLPFILILVQFACSKRIEPVSNNKPSYLQYGIEEINSFTIPKRSAEDILHNPIVFEKKWLIYYSDVTDTLTVFNFKSKQVIYHKLLKGDKIAGNVGYQQISDSSILVYYTSKLYVDSTIFSLNIFNGNRNYDYVLSHKDFLVKKEVSIDSLSSNPDLLYSKKNLGFGNPVFLEFDKSLLLPVISGSSDGYDQGLYSITEKVVRINSERKSDLLDISYSILDSTFNSSIPNSEIDNIFNFLPYLTPFDSLRALISFSINGDFIEYNCENGTRKMVTGFPNFFYPDTSLLVSYSTRRLEDVYTFHNFNTNPRSSFILRFVGIPRSSGIKDVKVPKEYRYIVYSKDPAIKAIGIISDFIDGHVVHIDDNETVYICNRTKSDTSRNLFYISECKLVELGQENDFFNLDCSPYSKISNKLSDYLSQVDKSLLEQDTIPLFFTFASCGPCVDKLGETLIRIKKNNLVMKPSIIVTRNAFQLEGFNHNFEVSSVKGLSIDTNAVFLNYMSHPNSFGYLIKNEEDYRFEPVKIDDLDNILNFVYPIQKIKPNPLIETKTLIQH